jgi:hypothetical protein
VSDFIGGFMAGLGTGVAVVHSVFDLVQNMARIEEMLTP